MDKKSKQAIRLLKVVLALGLLSIICMGIMVIGSVLVNHTNYKFLGLFLINLIIIILSFAAGVILILFLIFGLFYDETIHSEENDDDF